MLTTTGMAFVLALFAGEAAGPGDEGTKHTLIGVIQHDPKLEGGVWILDVKGMHYDLHGKLSGCHSGDTVEVEGRTSPEWVCYHMAGTVFKVTRIRVVESGGKGDRLGRRSGSDDRAGYASGPLLIRISEEEGQ
jgi:hypothetical protein